MFSVPDIGGGSWCQAMLDLGGTYLDDMVLFTNGTVNAVTPRQSQRMKLKEFGKVKYYFTIDWQI
jgi:hypothetical protein